MHIAQICQGSEVLGVPLDDGLQFRLRLVKRALPEIDFGQGSPKLHKIWIQFQGLSQVVLGQFRLVAENVGPGQVVIGRRGIGLCRKHRAELAYRLGTISPRHGKFAHEGVSLEIPGVVFEDRIEEVFHLFVLSLGETDLCNLVLCPEDIRFRFLPVDDFLIGIQCVLLSAALEIEITKGKQSSGPLFFLRNRLLEGLFSLFGPALGDQELSQKDSVLRI